MGRATELRLRHSAPAQSSQSAPTTPANRVDRAGSGSSTGDDGAFATGASGAYATGTRRPTSTPRSVTGTTPRRSAMQFFASAGRSSGLAGSSLRRRSQSEREMASIERYQPVVKSGSSPAMSPRRSRLSSLSDTLRGRSSNLSEPRLSNSRLSNKRKNSVNPIDLGVLESMTVSERIEEAHDDCTHDFAELKDQAPVEEMDTEDGCFICMGHFTEKRPAIAIPCSRNCNLSPVHAKCIYEWKEQKKGQGTCPLCRSELMEIAYRPPDLLRLGDLVMFNARRNFIMSPVPKAAGTLRCYIIARNGYWGSPVSYEFFVQAPTTLRYPGGNLPTAKSPEPGDRLLLTAHKRLTKWGNSVMDISLDEKGSDFRVGSPNYVGAVTGNTSGLDFTLTAPFVSSAHGSNAGGQRELLAVSYIQNRMGSTSGPRRMQVCVPPVREVDASEVVNGLIPRAGTSPRDVAIKTREDDPTEEDDDDDEDDEEKLLARKYITEMYRPGKKEDSLSSLLKKGGGQSPNGPKMFFGRNKEPYWLDSIQAYSLDFQGRVTLASNKNFQLEVDGMREAIAVQFGKVVGSDEEVNFSVYTVDMQWPFSPIQGLALALSACDRKALCA